MKKALSVFLAVLMICSCFAVGASAVTTLNQNPRDWFGAGKPATNDQCIILFDTMGGTIQGVMVYDVDKGGLVPETEVTGRWAMVPNAGYGTLEPGSIVNFPMPVAPANSAFKGWVLEANNASYGAGANRIPDVINGNTTAGTVLVFQAQYTPTVVEEDTMAKVLGVLAKVFGAIIGVLLYKGDTEAGIALVEKMLSGIVG